MSPLKLLVVTTKAPWPPIGGGNVLVHNLMTALVQLGAQPTVLTLGSPNDSSDAPYPIRQVAARPRPLALTIPHLWLDPPTALARYHLPALAAAMSRELETHRPDVVHIEQLHLAWLIRLARRSAPVVFRQQNVESTLLQRFAELRPRPIRWALLREARRVRRLERAACRDADVVAAISREDAEQLERLSETSNIRVLPPSISWRPDPEPQRLRGRPPLICLGSFDWAPNRDGIRWFLDRVWPEIQRTEPEAVLHLAGPGSRKLLDDGSPNVTVHGTVADVQTLYDPNGVVIVPVRAGSGVRLRILESWAADVPVVATTVGAEGLASGPDDGVLIADDELSLVSGTRNAIRDPELRRRLIANGRRSLAQHDPERTAREAVRLYEEAATRRRSTDQP